MRVLTVMGSPRFQGNTATVLGWVEDALSVGGHDVTRFNVVERNIYGCRACNTCKAVVHAPGCVITDDAGEVFRGMLESELVILASPMYCWGFTSQVKALLDRCYCMKKPVGEGFVSLLSGKRLALVMTAAGPVENNLALIEPVLSGIGWFMDVEIAGKLLVPGCTDPGNLDDGVKAQAKEFADNLALS